MRLSLKTTLATKKPIVPSMPGMSVLFALLAIYIIWGSTYLGIRIAIESFPPFMLTSIRLFVAGSLLLLTLLVRGTKLPTWEQARNAALVGGLMFGGGMGLVAFSEQWVASGLAALAVATVPIWAAIFTGIWGRWPGGLEWVGLIVGLLGVGLLNLEGGMQAHPLGTIALLIGPMGWAFGSMWSRRLSQPEGFMGTVIQLFGGGFVLFIMSLIAHESLTETPSTSSLFALAYLTFFGTFVAFSAYMYLVRTVRPALATSYAYVNPVIAVLLGVVLVAENITSVGILAMVVILTGVGLLALGKEGHSKEQDPA